ncbi:MAG TPA: muconolactone Delta-isomerase family protein, partial [Nitrososphaeraceae archaeon]
MLYLVTGKWIENPVISDEEAVKIWEHKVRPSLKSLEKMVEDDLIAGGIFAGQRRGIFIADASSHDEIANILSDLPFWDRIEWTVEPLESFRSAHDRERRIMERL